MPAIQSGSVLKRAPSRYEARWSNADGKRRAKVFRSKTEARAFLNTEVVEVAKRRRGEVAPDRPETVDALLDTFLEKHGRTVDPATERKLRAQLLKARSTFGTRRPDSLLKAEIDDWRDGLPAGSCHDVFRAFRQALSWSVERGLLENNATAGVKNPKRKRHERAAVHPFETWKEIESVAAELDERYRAIPIVGAGTGLRPEELFGLHRADVDRERMRLHVRRRFTQGMLKEGCKTESERFVPFGQRVLAALDAMPVRIDTLVLFRAPRGGHIDLEKFRHREWTPALRAAGIDHRRVNDLRHTYASWSLAADVPVAKLSRMMGTSVAQIEDTYGRFLRGDEERYGAALDAFGVGG